MLISFFLSTMSRYKHGPTLTRGDILCGVILAQMLTVQTLYKISHDSWWFKVYDTSCGQYDFSSKTYKHCFSLLVFAHRILSKREQLWTILKILYLIASYNVDYIQQKWLKSTVSLQTLP